jgi:outer membrane protein assembly factor BamB
VYTSSQDRLIYALDAKTGEKKWTFATQRGGYAVAVVDDVLYVGSVEGIVYALDARTGAKR